MNEHESDAANDDGGQVSAESCQAADETVESSEQQDDQAAGGLSAVPDLNTEGSAGRDPFQMRIKDLEQRLDQALRQLADRDNKVKRLQRDMPRQLEAREEGVLKKVLEIVDNFQRAHESMQQSVEIDRLREGNQAIYDQFKGFLAGYQVKPMEAPGRPFDPNLQEAVGQAPSADVPEGSVLAVVQVGYTYKDRVLRHARVIVATAPPGHIPVEVEPAVNGADLESETTAHETPDE